MDMCERAGVNDRPTDLLVLQRPVFDKGAKDRVSFDTVHKVTRNDIVPCL